MILAQMWYVIRVQHVVTGVGLAHLTTHNALDVFCRWLEVLAAWPEASHLKTGLLCSLIWRESRDAVILSIPELDQC